MTGVRRLPARSRWPARQGAEPGRAQLAGENLARRTEYPQRTAGRAQGISTVGHVDELVRRRACM